MPSGQECAGSLLKPNNEPSSIVLRFCGDEGQLGVGPWWGDVRFSLVDVVFAPVFRYFDTFDRIDDFGVFDGLAKVPEWRAALAALPSVRKAVSADYDQLLKAFFRRRGSALARRMPFAQGFFRDAWTAMQRGCNGSLWDRFVMTFVDRRVIVFSHPPHIRPSQTDCRSAQNPSEFHQRP